MENEKKIRKFTAYRKSFNMETSRIGGYQSTHVDKWCEEATKIINEMIKKYNDVERERNLLEGELRKIMNKSPQTPVEKKRIDRESRNSDPHHLVKRVAHLERELDDLKKKLDRIRKNK